jgi:hypothetical protein
VGTAIAEGWFGGESKVLAATSSSEAKWNLVQTPNGFVRFESVEYPGNMLTIYYNRRRRTDVLLELDKTTKEAAHDVNATHEAEEDDKKKKISDDDDLWPILTKFEEITPIGASFQVHEVMGKGLEIWDPQQQVSLSSSSKDGWFADDSASRGVAECRHESIFGGCEGREILSFEPALPASAHAKEEKTEVEPVAKLTKLQAGLILLAFAVLIGLYVFVRCGLLSRMR